MTRKPKQAVASTSRLSRIQRTILQAENDLRAVEAKLNDERRLRRKSKQELKACLEAQEIIQTTAVALQTQAHQKISSIVSQCLASVFGKDAYEFGIVFDEKRGKTEARMVFYRDGKEISPRGAAGGGVLDVASLGLRVARILMSNPPLRRLIVLDEPFRFIDEYRMPAAVELLNRLSEEFEIQFVMVSHDTELQFGKVVKIQ